MRLDEIEQKRKERTTMRHFQSCIMEQDIGTKDGGANSVH